MCEPPSNPTSNLAPAAELAARFAPTIGPAQSLITARESHVLHLLACAGMAVNTHGVHLEQAELLWVDATAAPAVRFRSAGASSLQALGGARALSGSGATSSFTSDNDQGVFEHLRLVDFWTFSSFAP